MTHLYEGFAVSNDKGDFYQSNAAMSYPYITIFKSKANARKYCLKAKWNKDIFTKICKVSIIIEDL